MECFAHVTLCFVGFIGWFFVFCCFFGGGEGGGFRQNTQVRETDICQFFNEHRKREKGSMFHNTIGILLRKK